MRSLVLNITGNCNLNCITCLRDKTNEKDLPLNVIRDIVQEGKKIGLVKVNITGGEPCLHKEFKKIIELLIKEKLFFSIVSNSIKFDDYKFIIDEHLDYLLKFNISLDGSTSEINDQIRGKGSYKLILKALDYLITNKIPFQVQYCINKINLDDIINFIHFCEHNKINQVVFLGMIKTGTNTEYMLNKQQKLRAINLINLYRKKFKLNLNIASSLETSGGIHFCKKMNLLTQLTINPNKDLVLCCDTINGGAVIGSITEYSLLKLYKEALNLVKYIKTTRLIYDKPNKDSIDYNTCEFCNKLLKKMIIRD